MFTLLHPLLLSTALILIMMLLYTMLVVVEPHVTTGSPHSQNGSPTTGFGLSLEAGPSVTGV